MKQFFSTTNPAIFFLLIASGIVSIILTTLASIPLILLLVMILSGSKLTVGTVFLFSIVLAMLVLAMLNGRDALMLMDDMDAKRLVTVLLRSLVALIPVAAIVIVSNIYA